MAVTAISSAGMQERGDGFDG